MSELYQLDVSALAAKLAAREVSSVEVTQALLERAKANADLGAYLALDEEISLAQASAADARLAAGELFALVQFGFHRVEGSDVGLLPLSCFLAGETHRQKNEAIPGDGVSWSFFALGIRIFSRRKIALAKFFTALKVANGAKHVFVQFFKPCCNLQAGGSWVVATNINVSSSQCNAVNSSD